jgi:hypothetical protein
LHWLWNDSEFSLICMSELWSFQKLVSFEKSEYKIVFSQVVIGGLAYGLKFGPSKSFYWLFLFDFKKIIVIFLFAPELRCGKFSLRSNYPFLWWFELDLGKMLVIVKINRLVDWNFYFCQLPKTVDNSLVHLTELKLGVFKLLFWV